jgi:ribosomal protein S18 acetylase RimI-like enzyme
VTAPIEIRRATGEDSLAVARVHIETWRAAYRGIVPAEFLDSLNVQRRAHNYTFDASGTNDPGTWIALDAGQVVGFVTIGYPKSDSEDLGEVQALYVASDEWRKGVGLLLLKEAETLLADAGASAAYLWVLEDNERGRRFYDAQGWRHDGGEQSVHIGGQALVELRYYKTFDSPKNS